MLNAGTLGVVLLTISGSSVIGAVVLGVVAGLGEWDRERIIMATLALAALSEFCFWAGGGLLGLSALRRRRPAFRRIAARFSGRSPARKA